MQTFPCHPLVFPSLGMRFLRATGERASSRASAHTAAYPPHLLSPELLDSSRKESSPSFLKAAKASPSLFSCLEICFPNSFFSDLSQRGALAVPEPASSSPMASTLNTLTERHGAHQAPIQPKESLKEAGTTERLRSLLRVIALSLGMRLLEFTLVFSWKRFIS